MHTQNSHQKLSEKSPTDIVNAYFGAFGTANVKEALALIDENVIWHIDGRTEVSTVGLLYGREQVSAWLKNFPLHFEPKTFVVDKMIEQGDEVVAFGRFRHLIKSTGNIIGSDLVIRFQIRNEKIIRYQIFEDSGLLARAFNESQEQWENQEIRINGTIYSYSDIGDGPVIVFAHGLFVDRSIFEAQVNELKKTNRCIVLDMPGHGKSGFNKQGWTLENIADDIQLIIEELSWGEKITFVGQSQGAMVGMLLAAKAPELISNLVLIGTSARAEYCERIEKWQSFRQVLLQGTKEQREKAFIDLQNRINAPQWLHDNPTETEKERKIMLSHNKEGLTLALDAAVLQRKDIRDRLPEITAKTLVICGDCDQATPVELHQEIASIIPNAELVILEGVAHHPPIEAPQQVLSVISKCVMV